ncbi:uracil-DNA glycosylase [Geminicoccus harenae]|uniref:uracil-DNA glycosylase n=2 Tax=Geminicoccus harenae TaxID=2498453 RepID=UPI001C969579|nr:uracil-DNA glycosylase [Geminicoccus harenae]
MRLQVGLGEEEAVDRGLHQLRAWLAWQQAAGAVDLVGDPAERSLALPSTASPLPEAAEPTGLRPLADLLPGMPAQAIAPPARRPETGDVAAARRLALACPDLTALEAALAGFEGCALRRTATRLCFADGNPMSPLVLVGEAPGAEEDRQGKPFVGPSGRLLDRMLATIGLDRSRFWITNCLFWRPPGNRTPSPQEVAVCQPFLERALELVQPKIVLFVGGTAARTLLGLEAGVTRLRGTLRSWHPDWSPAPIGTLVTFHPAYLLRNPAQKKLVWRDLLQLSQRLDAISGQGGPEGRPH